MDCSIIVLTYNSEDDLDRCLSSALDQDTDLEYEIIVADNDSSDDTVATVEERYPEVTVVEFDENHGASRGYNLALEHATGEYVVFLNPDTTVHRDWLQNLYRGVRDSDAVAGHSSIFEPGDDHFTPDLTEDYPGATKVTDVSTTGYVLKREFESTGDPFRTLDLHGASMMFEADLFDRLDHHFEEEFFLFADDIDMALRLNALGEKVVLVPDSVVYHHQEGLADPTPVTWMARKHVWAASGRFLSFFKNMYLAEFLLFVPLMLLGGVLNARELRVPLWKRVVYALGGIPLTFLSAAAFLTKFRDVADHRQRILERRSNGRFWMLKRIVLSSPPRLEW